MKTLNCLVLGLGVALSLNALADTNTNQAPRLKGMVVDSAGRPLDGAVVETRAVTFGPGSFSSEPQSVPRTITKADGSFDIAAPSPGGVMLIRKDGLAPAWRQFHRVPGLEQRFVLAPPTVLAGVVVDENDKPVADAEVSVAIAISETERAGGGRSVDYLTGTLARDAFHTRTAANGRFRIDGFPTNASADLLVKATGKALRQAAREYVGPDTMQCRAGQQDIRLILEPAGTVEGRITADAAGSPLPIALLTLQPDGSGYFGFAEPSPAHSSPDGSFGISDVPAGSYRAIATFGTNLPPDWVAEGVAISVESGQTNRDVKITATRGGLLEAVVLRQENRQPQAQASISAYKEGYQAGAAAGSNGVALLRVVPGEYQIAVTKEGFRTESTTVTAEAGRTNRVEIELAPAPKIAGVVRRPDGQPAVGLEVRLVGAYFGDEPGFKTDSEGKFNLPTDPNQFGRRDMTPCLLVRDPERNLAVAQDIEEDTGSLDLRLAPGMTLAGRAECDGQPLTNATAALVFWTGNSGMHLYGLARGTNQPGHFEITALPTDRKYGLYVSAPGYGQKYVNAAEGETEAKRIELDPVELSPANLKLAGQVLDADDKPVSGASVHLSGEGQPNSNTRTDRDGRFRFEHVCEGPVQLYANARNSNGNITAEGGDTNVVVRLGESSSYSGAAPRKLKGMVTDPDGKPSVGAEVTVFPEGGSRWTKTGTNGAFNLTYSIQPWQLQSGGDPCLVVRDTARNLAASMDLSEDTTNVTVKLEPALTITGRVEGADGTPLPKAEVGLWLLACRSYSSVGDSAVTTDASGGYEIKNLPVGREYIVFASAKDHGRSQENVQPDSETNRVELPPFVLNVADQVLAGQVLNPNEKPASGVSVSLSGEGQPQASATTDSKGRFSFKVCEGQVRLWASGANSYANVTAEAGDTNVIVQLGRSDSSVRESPRRASMQGKPLPDLTGFGIAADAVPAGRPVLLCLFDAEQRPSRRAVRVLADQHDALRQKGLTIVALQAAPAADDRWEEWRKAYPMPFPLGRVSEKSSVATWATGVKSLPWLILSSAQGKVAAEGFPVEELDAKLDALKKD